MTLQTLLACPGDFSTRVKSGQNQISSKSQAMNSKTTFLTLSGVATGYTFGFVDTGYENQDGKVLTNLFTNPISVVTKHLKTNTQLEKI